MNTFDEQLQELLNTVREARANYDIWWIYINNVDRPKYLDVLNTYAAFFQVGSRAHFVAMVMALYKLCDRRRDSASIPTLLADARKNPAFSSSVITEAEAKLNSVQAVWNKVQILRHKLFAHRDRHLDFEAVFANAHITPDELRSLTQELLDLLNDFLYYRERTRLDFESYFARQTYQVLDALQSGIRAT